MADTTSSHDELFELLKLALERKGEKRTRNAHMEWTSEHLVDGVFTPSVQKIPAMLVGTRSENALQQMFNRATEKLGTARLDVLEVNEDTFLIIDWNAEDVKEALSDNVL